MSGNPPPSFSSFPDILSGPSSSGSQAPQRDDSRDGERKRKKKKKDTPSYEVPRDAYQKALLPKIERRLRVVEDRHLNERDHVKQFTLNTGLVASADISRDPVLLFLPTPKYPHPQGGGRILGVPDKYRIFRRNERLEITVPVKQPRDSIRALSDIQRIKAKRIRPSNGRPLPGEHRNFIPLPGAGRLSKPPDLPAHREITNLDKSDDGAEYSSSDDDMRVPDSDEEGTMENAHYQETKRLATLMIQNPTNIQHLLAAITFTASRGNSPAEIWIAMLQRAFLHPLNRRSDVLRLKYLHYLREVRPPQEVENEWDKVLNEVKSENVWVEYISYKLSTGGHASDPLEEALDRVRVEMKVIDQDDERLQRAQVRIFWRVLTAVRESGYHERAFSAFQAQIELQYFRPIFLKKKQEYQQMLDMLEKYWDAEVPRVGEVGRLSWQPWIASMPGEAIPTIRSGAKELPDPSDDALQRWAKLEASEDLHGWMPLRDPGSLVVRESGDDTFDITTFDLDIRKFLYLPLLPPLGEPQDESLAYIFLHFLGLHIPGLSESLQPTIDDIPPDSAWADTRFAHNQQLLSSLFSFPDGTPDTSTTAITPSSKPWSLIDGVIAGRERQMGHGWGPVKHWGYGVLDPLEGYGPGGEGRMWECKEIFAVDHVYIRRLFSQMSAAALKSERWAVHWLAFEAALDVKEAIRVAKTLLEASPESFVLWRAYAQLERIRGKTNLARKVYQKCLPTNQPSVSPAWLPDTTLSPKHIDERKLWWSWAEMEWLDGKDAEAMWVLCAAVGVHSDDDPSRGMSGHAILRARAAYERLVNVDILPERDALMPAVNSLALLTLLHSRDIKAALAVYTKFIERASQSQIMPPVRADQITSFMHLPRTLRETLYVNSGLLIYRYTILLRNSASPGVLRQHMDEAIKTFPGNTMLLGLWLETERGEGVWGRVRQGVSDIILGGHASGGDLHRWFWAIWSETWQTGVWEPERVRTIFRKGIVNPTTRLSPTFWHVFINFEIKLGNLSIARNLLSQAIGLFRWYKDFYLIAFGPLRSQYDAEDLCDPWLCAMADRGIRLRLSLAPFLEEEEGDEEEEAEDGGDSDEMEGELEHDANERRRLMPY